MHARRAMAQLPLHIHSLVVLATFTAVVGFGPASLAHDTLEDRFQQYIRDFRKPYSSGGREYNERLLHFKVSLERVEELNAYSRAKWNESVTGAGETPGPATYGLTQFSDMSPEEFQAGRQCVHGRNGSALRHSTRSAESFLQEHVDYGEPPAKWDWRNQGVVTAVKNQQSCGSCWAFAAIETIESAWAIKNSVLYSLSVQQLISCDQTTGNAGCSGGRYETAYEWMIENKETVDFDSEYPYYDSKGAALPCRTVSTTSPVTVKAYQSLSNVTTDNEQSVLMRGVYYYGPLAITVDAKSWQDYVGGIVQHHCTQTYLDHAVVIVGYDTTGPVPYWIVRNTWGGGWGNGGYMYIEMGKNLCGIDYAPAYVTVTQSNQ